MSVGTNSLPRLFGRKWQLQVSLPASATAPIGGAGGFGAFPLVNPGQILFTIPEEGDDYNPQALKVTFDIETNWYRTYWTAEIVVWNADVVITDQILGAPAQGMLVTLSAGYENGNYGVIWSGPIFQAFLERENVTDTKLIMWCLLNLPPLTQPIAGGSIAAFQNQKQIIQQIAKVAQTPVDDANLPNTFTVPPLPRGQAFFGNMSQYFDEIADANNLQWWISSKGLNMGDILEDIKEQDELTVVSPIEGETNAANAPPDIVFTPAVVPGAAGPQQDVPEGATQSIIGTPQQTMFGVNFRVLMDPRIEVRKPPITVKIDNTNILFLKSVPNQLVWGLDQNKRYVVVGVRHIGDTRGNPWYTEIVGWTRSKDILDGVLASSLLT